MKKMTTGLQQPIVDEDLVMCRMSAHERGLCGKCGACMSIGVRDSDFFLECAFPPNYAVGAARPI